MPVLALVFRLAFWLEREEEVGWVAGLAGAENVKDEEAAAVEPAKLKAN